MYARIAVARVVYGVIASRNIKRAQYVKRY